MFPRRSASQPTVREDPRRYGTPEVLTLHSSIPLGDLGVSSVSSDKAQTSEPAAGPQIIRLARSGARDHVSTVLLTQKLPGP